MTFDEFSAKVGLALARMEADDDDSGMDLEDWITALADAIDLMEVPPGQGT